MVSMVALPQAKNPEQTKSPVFIEFTPEYARQHGLSREIDRRPVKKTEGDTIELLNKQQDLHELNNTLIAASISPKEAIGWIGVAKAVVDFLIYGYDEFSKRYGKDNADMAKAAVALSMADTEKENKLDIAA